MSEQRALVVVLEVLAGHVCNSDSGPERLSDLKGLNKLCEQESPCEGSC